MSVFVFYQVNCILDHALTHSNMLAFMQSQRPAPAGPGLVDDVQVNMESKHLTVRAVGLAEQLRAGQACEERCVGRACT